MDCSSKKMADELNCGKSSFDIQKVKNEVHDELFEMCTADTSEKTSHPLSLEWSLLNAVKKEILEEPKFGPNVLEKTKRKRGRKIKEKTFVQTSPIIAPKQMPAVSMNEPAVAILTQGAQSKKKNPLLKPKNPISESNIRIAQVFYTDQNQYQNSERQVTSQPSAHTTYSSTFTSLPTNILSNPVVPSVQQNSNTINSVSNLNSLQPSNVIQGLQNIHFIPGLQGLGGLSLNQNASLALHQTNSQDVNPSTHDPVVSVQPSQCFPILMGNQVFLVDAATYKTINSTVAGRKQPPIMSTGSPAVSTLYHQSSTHPDKSISKEKESKFSIDKKVAEKRKRLSSDVFGSTQVIKKVKSRTSSNRIVQGSNSKCINSMSVGVSNKIPVQDDAVRTNTSNIISSTANFETCNVVKQTLNSADLCLSSNVSQNTLITPSIQQTFFLSPQQNFNFGQTSCSIPSNFFNLVNNPGLIISNAHDLQRPHLDKSVQNTTNKNISITGNISTVSSVNSSFNIQPALLNSNASFVQTTFVSIAPTVVPSTVKNIEEAATGMVIPAKILPKKPCAHVNKEPLKIKEKTPVPLGNFLELNNSRKLVTKSGSNSSTSRSSKPHDEASKSSSKQTVGTKILSPTSKELQPSLKDLFDKEFGGNSSENGRVLVGPLTKTELDNIIRNPDELKKYVNIPTDQVVIAPKALAVSSNTSKSSKTVTTNSKVLKIAPKDKSIPTIINNTCSKLVKLLPKTDKITIASCMKPSVNKSSNYNGTNNNDRVVTEQNQVSVPGSESTTQNAMCSDLKKVGPIINMSSSIRETNKKDISITPREPNDIKTINKDSSSKETDIVTVNSTCTQSKSYLSHQLSEVKQDPLNGLMRLSFEGDIKLLKDLLRRTTVPLQKLTCGLNDTVKIKEAKVASASEQVHSNIKHPINIHQTVTILDQNIPKKRKLLCCNYSLEKQLVPTDSISDQEMNGQISKRPSFFRMKDNAKRKSPRINTNPLFKYTQCEISLSDDDSYHAKAEIKSCVKAKETLKKKSSISENDLNKPNLHCVVQSIERQSSDHILKLAEEKSNTKQEVLLAVPVNTVIKDENAQNFTQTHPLPSSPTEESNSISQEHDESCYSSSESDSDLFDLDTDVLSKREKKRMMLKHHNEVTMFLIKNSGKFSSKEEANEHYCNICNKYKTNGIFNLSKHLKKHLQGLLKCSQCSYEACNEDALSQHLLKHC